MADKMEIVRVGSRKSELAMIQTNHVVEMLQKVHPETEFKIVTMETIGDHIQDKPLASIGESNLFTKELEKALALDEVDMLVHSLKDMPSRLPSNMAIGAICEREDPHDALVLHKKLTGISIETMKEGSVLGTSSVRRVAQLKRKFPHLVFKDVRGNLNTRLRKLDEGQVYDGLVLAVAGMMRMGWEHRISQILKPDICKYSVSQGALGIEIKTKNRRMHELLRQLNHVPTLIRCIAERGLLKTLEGGCSAPVAVHSELEENRLTLNASVLSLDGSELREEEKSITLPQELTQEHSLDAETNEEMKLFSSVIAPWVSQHAMQEAEALGVSVAKGLFDKGAGPILEAAKEEIAERRK
ncbi:porphobilinogen deaminase [Strongylocentrotus purpuratus]|uniref:hydroxymethylbilane synthase n=1 Tax=Strongylocentrotus purpuratus TaxID=7668 RepID=A0A7M7RCV3_STRPU|nr:porphobilinogen deaminase [Strongylocentrotus purpuratus]|eukprot:XP_781025.2 PREDICTED: porphobilinogen deaminase isoform X1 [Strongylocentrotus purpuratus]